ncbi:MAG: YncE family protein [Ferrimicrobium sp.]
MAGRSGRKVGSILVRALAGTLLLGGAALTLIDPGVAWASTPPTIVERIGLYPLSLAVDSATNTLFVEGRKSLRISEATKWWLSTVSGTTGKVIGTLDMGVRPWTLTAVNPKTNTAYAVNATSVYVINGATDKVIRVIPVASNGLALAVDPATNTLYLAGRHNGLDAYYGKPNANTVLAIDGTTGRVERTIDVNDSTTSIDEIETDPATDMFYVIDRDSILAISGATDKVIRKIPLSSDAFSFAVNPGSDTLYEVNSHSVSAVALQSPSHSPASSGLPFELGAIVVAVGGSAALLVSTRRRRSHEGDSDTGASPACVTQ